MTLSRKLYIWWFLLRRIPIIPFLGIKVLAESDTGCKVVIPRTWRNRNPFGITYFAALVAAGEMAGGMLIIPHVLNVRERGVDMAVVIRNVNAAFKRMADGPIYFRCEQGEEVRDAIAQAQYSGKPELITLRSVGYNEAGKVAVSVDITWLLKVKRH